MDFTDLRLILLKELHEIAPSLKLDGHDTYDKRVYRIAESDLRLYIMWLHKEKYPNSNEYDIIADLRLEEEEAKEFVALWTKRWFKKWLIRTKLVLTKDEIKRYDSIVKKNEAKGTPLMQMVNQSTFYEMAKQVAFTLVESGEICGTSVLSHQLLNMEFNNKKWEKQRIEGKMQAWDIVNLTTATKRKAKQMSQTHGPLIFIRITDFKVREFRNDNHLVNGK